MTWNTWREVIYRGAQAVLRVHHSKDRLYLAVLIVAIVAAYALIAWRQPQF